MDIDCDYPESWTISYTEIKEMLLNSYRGEIIYKS